MRKLILIATAAGALLTADFAAAQTPPPPPAPPAAANPGAPQGYGRLQGPGGPGGYDGRGFDRAGRFDGGRFGGRGRFGRRGFRRPSLEEVQKRNADLFARLDANHDGRVTLQEFHADIERRRTEREKAMFDRFSGGQDSVTLAQLNARAAQRLNGGPAGPGGQGRGPGRAPAAPPVNR